MESIEIWKELAKSGSIILFMGIVIVWVLKRLKEKEKKIDDLNGEINKSNKENLLVLGSINSSLDKFIEVQKSFGEKIIEVQITKTEAITDRIDNLKESIDVKINFLIENSK